MMQQYARPADFNDLAADYDRYRIGYSADLFDLIATFGLQRGVSVLDAGCGTGLSTEPLVRRGLRVTGIDASGDMLASAKRQVPAATFVEGSVEALPFEAAQFDAAVSAQAFHWFDADRAFAELIRVVKPGGPIAIWWKILGSDDPMRALRAGAAATAGVKPPDDPLRGGFQAFYRAPLASRSLRVLPFATRFRVDDWLGYERSRAASRNAYGDKREAYLEALRAELSAKYNGPTDYIDVRYTQFLYIGVTTK